jgi:mannitol-1-phosphate 5-dehydrogenase
VDVNQAVIDALNAEKSYPVTILSNDSEREILVKNVCAKNAGDGGAVARRIADADLMATAVGVNVLPYIIGNLAAGIRLRAAEGKPPLNVIICENLIGADKYIAGLLREKLNGEERRYMDENIGLVEASIGRMVPVQTPEMQRGNLLRVCVEAYCALPVDCGAWKGEIPDYPNLKPFSPFEFYIERKLFVHNMGHAAAAYLGFLRGYTYIWEAVGDAEIRETVLRAMTESAVALSRKHGVDFYELYLHVEDFLERFANRKLGDTVARVGRDLKRKLSENDRMLGAARLCAAQGVENTHILKGLGAALLFADDGKKPDLSALAAMAKLLTA